MPLKGVPAILPPQLLAVLAAMGHGDELLIADANFPSSSQGVGTVLHLPGSSATDLLDAILTLFPLDSFDAHQASVMQQVHSSEDAPIVSEFQRILDQSYAGSDGAQRPAAVARLERFAFYERAKTVYAIVATGETRLYGNVMIKKGVIDGAGRTVVV
ncbi:FucU, fucose operon fucU protein [Chytriomyces sp. MP71]|nr:FucU, fucose operon fucU protein [Chytriomyces sp. MP71]